MCYLHTTNLERRAIWLRLFGVDRLPVLSPRPRWQVGRGEFREVEILAYDLDLSRLHWMAQERAGRALGCTVAELSRLPIKAGADVVIENESETAVLPEWVKRPFTLGAMYATP